MSISPTDITFAVEYIYKVLSTFCEDKNSCQNNLVFQPLLMLMVDILSKVYPSITEDQINYIISILNTECGYIQTHLCKYASSLPNCESLCSDIINFTKVSIPAPLKSQDACNVACNPCKNSGLISIGLLVLIKKYDSTSQITFLQIHNFMQKICSGLQPNAAGQQFITIPFAKPLTKPDMQTLQHKMNALAAVVPVPKSTPTPKPLRSKKPNTLLIAGIVVVILALIIALIIYIEKQ